MELRAPAMKIEENGFGKAEWFLSGTAVGLALLMVGAWLNARHHDNEFMDAYTNVYAIVALLGAFLGMTKYQSIPRDENPQQRMVVFTLSVALLFWVAGQMAWTYF